MKLVPKMTSLFSVVLFCALAVSMSLVYIMTRAFIINEAKNRASIMVGVIESQLHLGAGKETASGTNIHFQDLADSLKRTISEIEEINIYRIASGSAVASTDPDLMGKLVDPEDLEAAEEDRTVTIIENEEGRFVVDITAPLHFQDAIEYVTGIKIDMLAEQHFLVALLLRNGLIAALVLAAAAAGIGALVRNFSQPILSSAEKLNRMAEGNLDQHLSVKSADELGVMARAFNTFIQELRAIVVNLKASGVKSKAASEELVANTSEVARSAERIDLTMNRMKERSKRLDEAIDTANSAMRDIKTNIDHIAALIPEQSASVQESSASVEQMITNVENIQRTTESKKVLMDTLLEKAKMGESRMAQNVAAIADISKFAGTISNLLVVIDDVSVKTNLLAMNAAIEAAHAGQAGKGFSVVADEIRKLSETTTRNSKDISVSIHAIMEKISETRQITTETSASIAEVWGGIREVAGGLTETLDGLTEISLGNKQITEAIAELNDLTAEVTSSSKIIESQTNRVNESMESIHGISHENMEGIEEVTSNMDEISKAIAELAKLSVSASETILTIETETGRFVGVEAQPINA